jgi:hypothetical protein
LRQIVRGFYPAWQMGQLIRDSKEDFIIVAFDSNASET